MSNFKLQNLSEKQASKIFLNAKFCDKNSGVVASALATGLDLSAKTRSVKFLYVHSLM